MSSFFGELMNAVGDSFYNPVKAGNDISKMMQQGNNGGGASDNTSTANSPIGADGTVHMAPIQSESPILGNSGNATSSENTAATGSDSSSGSTTQLITDLDNLVQNPSLQNIAQFLNDLVSTLPNGPGDASNGAGTTSNPGDTSNGVCATSNSGDNTNGAGATSNPGDTSNGASATTNPGDVSNGASATSNPGDVSNGACATTSTGDASNGASAATSTGDTSNGASATSGTGDASTDASCTPTPTAADLANEAGVRYVDNDPNQTNIAEGQAFVQAHKALQLESAQLNTSADYVGSAQSVGSNYSAGVADRINAQDALTAARIRQGQGDGNNGISFNKNNPANLSSESQDDMIQASQAIHAARVDFENSNGTGAQQELTLAAYAEQQASTLEFDGVGQAQNIPAAA